MHLVYSSSQFVSLQRHCTKITSFGLNSFSVLRSLKQSKAEFANCNADWFSTLPDSTTKESIFNFSILSSTKTIFYRMCDSFVQSKVNIKKKKYIPSNRFFSVCTFSFGKCFAR